MTSAGCPSRSSDACPGGALDSSRDSARRAVAWPDRYGTVLAAVLGLALGALTLGPGLGRGYLLSYDMVFVPRPAFNAAMFGLSGTLPRAVPSDFVVAMLARALPADIVQKLLLLAVFVLACSGAARLLGDAHWLARLAAGVFYTWNPFVAERLLLGQWALLLGYAGLPWVLHALTTTVRPAWHRITLLVLVLVPAAVGGFAAMCVSALVVIPAAAALGSTLRQRLGFIAAALGAWLVLSMDWLVPALSQPVLTSPAGVAAFAPRADTPFGSLGSLVMLGGAWNAQTVPAGYGTGVLAVAWFVVALAAVGCFVLLGRRWWPGLGVAAVAGLAVASLDATAVGQDLLRHLIELWPGFAVLRDGQQFVAPLALAEAVGFGLGLSWLLRRGLPDVLREGTAVLAAVVLITPVVTLPGLAWGDSGRLVPTWYPASWQAARRLIDGDQSAGKVLLLPWAAYRRFGWNDGEAVLDPWPRLLRRDVVWNDALQVGTVLVPPESPAARSLSTLIKSGAPLTGPLSADGFRYVIIDDGLSRARTGSRAGGVSSRFPGAARLGGCAIVIDAVDLVVCRLPSAVKT